MDWQELERMIKTERRAGNPVAGLISGLDLQNNRATLLLSNLLDEEEEVSLFWASLLQWVSGAGII